MQRDREFDHSQVWSEVTTGIGERIDQGVPDFLRELGKFFRSNFFEVIGAIDLAEKRCFRRVGHLDRLGRRRRLRIQGLDPRRRPLHEGKLRQGRAVFGLI